MSSIFPSYREQLEEQNKATELPILRDIAIDFTTGEPIIKDGDFVIVEKDEAIKVWCYFALKTAKNRFLAFSSKYGQTFEEIINSDEEDINLKNRVKDCLLVNKYIKSVDKVECEFNDSTLEGKIYITTVYSEGVEVNV